MNIFFKKDYKYFGRTKKISIFVMCLTQRECQPSHLKADRRESGDGKRFGLDRDLPQLD